jgi:hypothetical protein
VSITPRPAMRGGVSEADGGGLIEQGRCNKHPHLPFGVLPPQSALRLRRKTTAPYIAEIPPSTFNSDPVTKPLSSLARYTAA